MSDLLSKSMRAWPLILLFACAAWVYAEAVHTPPSPDLQDICDRNKPLGSSNEDARGGRTPTLPDLAIIQAPEVHPGPLSRRFPQGSRLVRLAPSDPLPRCLTPEFFAAASPRASFDGACLLFAGKKTADSPWQIWEMNVDGSGTHQITRCPGDCLAPAYLPRGEIVYTKLAEEPAAKAPVGPGTGRVAPPITNSAARPGATSQLWVSKSDGSDAHPITFGPGDFQVETVLKNGSILVTASFPLLPSTGLPAARELYTLRPDGTGLATLRCDHQRATIRSQAQELDDGTVIFVQAPLSSPTLAEDLAWIRRGALHQAMLTSPPILVSSPQPIAAHELLVARESAAGHATGKKLGIYVFHTASTKVGTRIYEDPKLSAVEAVPLAAHEPPRWYWSTLNPSLERGYFVCLDSHLAEGLPQGRIAAKLVRLRALTLNAATQRESVLGEAPIEQDGSFYIAVPPDKPVRFEVLDAAGRVVRAQRSWIWARSGEEHGCVGCHEDRALAPENRWPMALRRFDTPTRLDLANHAVNAH